MNVFLRLPYLAEFASGKSLDKHRIRRAIVRLVFARFLRKADSMLSDIGQVVPESVQRILVINPNHRLGNQILISPLIRELEDLFPGAEIELLLAGSTGSELFARFRSVGRVHELPRYIARHLILSATLILAMRRTHYDLAIDPNAESTTSRILLGLVRARSAIGAPYRGSKKHANWARLLFFAPRHAAKLPIFLTRHAIRGDARIDESQYPKPDIGLTRFELMQGKRLIAEIVPELTAGTIVMGICANVGGAKRFDRHWWERFLGSLKQSGLDLSVIEFLADDHQLRLSDVYPALYANNPRKLAAAIAQMDCFVSADCGVMQLAVASGAATVGIFSVTDRGTNEPYGANNHSVHTLTKEPEGVARIVARKIRAHRDLRLQTRRYPNPVDAMRDTSIDHENPHLASSGWLQRLFPPVKERYAIGPFRRSRGPSYANDVCTVESRGKNSVLSDASLDSNPIVHENGGVCRSADSTIPSARASARRGYPNTSIFDPQESPVVDRRRFDAKRVIADETCLRIESLTANHLLEVACSEDGCSRLCKDPDDGRLWECTYPDSELPQGGPPTLHSVSALQARWMYGYDT
jgi:heptosyltransferase III